MSIFRSDSATYDDNGRWVRHTITSELGRGDLFIIGDDDTDGSVVMRLINGVARFQIRENGIFKDVQLLPMVGENLVYDNDLNLVLDNSLNPVYSNKF